MMNRLKCKMCNQRLKIHLKDEKNELCDGCLKSLDKAFNKCKNVKAFIKEYDLKPLKHSIVKGLLIFNHATGLLRVFVERKGLNFWNCADDKSCLFVETKK